jgi:nucleoside-diphosphate-sugar epimerase
MRIASLRPHWCIPDNHPLPPQLLPHAPTTFQTVTSADVVKAPNSDFYRQLWGWNTYNSIARAFFLAITVENRDWVDGHEVFFIVSPRIGSNQHPMELIKEYFPKAEVRKELGNEDGLYDCSKAERILGWKHDE